MSFLDFIRTTSPRLPGRVARVLDSGNAFIDSDVTLPMTSGDFTDSFFVPHSEALHLNEGDSVTFQWKNPGEPGSNPRGGSGSPVANQVSVVTEDERNSLTHSLRVRQNLLQDLPHLLSENANIESILEEAEEVFSDPQAAISAALAVFKQARTIVEDEAQASARIQELTGQLATLDRDLEEYRNLRAAVQAEEERLAPLRAFAASVRFDESDSEPRHPDLPSTDVSLMELDRTLAPLATDFVRWTTLLALLTVAVNGRLLLLDGPVGTGKSKLAEKIALSCGGRCEVIPVRPAWVEPSDLLGFFDPLSQVFRPGPFTDAVTSPMMDRLNVVVLDEMNLARIENYGADILSRAERIAQAHQEGTTPVGIPTWSPAEWQALKSEWESLVSLDAQTPETARRVAQLRHTFRYRPNLNPIDGLAIIGTVNTDDTTYDVSPKVIDRSFAVAFPTATFDSEELVPSGQRYGLSIRRLRNVTSEHRHASHRSLWQRLLETVDEKTMAKIGVPYSYRLATDFDSFTSIGSYLEVPEDDLLAMFVFSRVLPRIRFFKDDGRVDVARSAIERVRELQGSQPDRAWKGLLDRLDNQCQDERARIVRFWHDYSS